MDPFEQRQQRKLHLAPACLAESPNSSQIDFEFHAFSEPDIAAAQCREAIQPGTDPRPFDTGQPRNYPSTRAVPERTATAASAPPRNSSCAGRVRLLAAATRRTAGRAHHLRRVQPPLTEALRGRGPLGSNGRNRPFCLDAQGRAALKLAAIARIPVEIGFARTRPTYEPKFIR